MDLLEKEVIRYRIQIKHNLRKLVENTHWNKSLENLLIGYGLFNFKSLELIKSHSKPIEQLYEEMFKQGYCYKPSDILTVLNTLSIAFKESDNSEAAQTLNLMIQKTSCDRINFSGPSENANDLEASYSSSDPGVKINTIPNWNDAIDWKILSERIVWNKCLEKKLEEYRLWECDVLRENGFPKDKTENLYQRIRKISFKLVPNRDYKQLYTRFIKVLVESGNYRAASILDLSESIREISSIKKKPSGRLHSPTGRCVSPNPNRMIELAMALPPNSPTPTRSIEFDDDFPSPRPPLRIDVRKATLSRKPPSTSSCYTMTSKPRGSILIINNETFNDPAGLYSTRYGSTIDANNLSILFEQLGFQYTLKDNRTYREMQDDIYEFAQLKEAFDANMRILVVLSHGDKSNVLTVDGFKLPYEWIISQFNNYNCPQLRGKPKLFIFPACRGSNPDYGVLDDVKIPSTHVDSLGSDASVVMMPSPMVSRSGKRLPMYGDMLIAYGTIPGYVANRDTMNGSWYIECLCTVFMENSYAMELMEMLAEISREMLKYESEFGTVQTSSYEVRGCFNKLYFNPGL